MPERIYWSPVRSLFATALISAASVVSAQQVLPPDLSQGVSYLPQVSSPVDKRDDPSPLSDTNFTPANFGTYENCLADEVAELKAWKKKVLAKEAAKKKKAAGKPSVKVGGRFMWDTANFNQDANSVAQIGDVENGSEPRRARIFLKGEAFDVVDYKLQFAFDNSSELHFKDLFITIKKLPYLDHVRIGHFKEPFSLDQLTSSKYLMFMERNLADVFAPSRNTGVMAFDQSENKRMTWAIGAFKDQLPDNPPTFHDDHSATALTMRYTFAPWYDECNNGRSVIHTGIGYSYRDAANDTVRFRQRPEAHLSSRVVDTGLIDAEDYHLLNAELAFVYGPFSVQSEYISTSVNQTGAAGTANFDGYYVQASYFLTGEHRPYRRSDGTFGRVKPLKNFFRVRDCNGCVQMAKGAWEIGYRFSHLDLNDAGITGGSVSDHTLGLNWYLNPYTRAMWNYVRSDVDRSPSGGGAVINGAMDIFEMRLQIDF